MRLMTPILTFLFHLLELVAAVLLFPLTALCMFGLMIFTLYIAWQTRPRRSQSRVLQPALLVAHS